MSTRSAAQEHAADPLGTLERRHRPFLYLCGFVGLLAAGLLVYSQTIALAWDEGFHLLAAQLILHGRTPYLDFFHAQTPLYAYWNAFWMRIFGASWRTAHTVSTLFTAGAVMLTADLVFARFKDLRGQLAWALLAAMMVGLNTAVVEYGTVGQAYGLCLFLIIAAFRVTIVAVDRQGWPLAAAAGFLSGAASAASLLTAPVGPVLLIWMLWYNRAGGRWAKFAAFIGATMVPFFPLLWLFTKAPRRVFFQAVEFHLFYRDAAWKTATQHNLEVLISWANDPAALLLGLLAAVGLCFIASKSVWDREHRAEFYLCGWLTLVLSLYLFKAHPTFARYFLLVVPFLTVLATAGLYAIVSGVEVLRGPRWPVLVIGLVLAVGLGEEMYERRDDHSWPGLEQVARKVNDVTPPQGMLLADEPFYFLTRRVPPSGMEYGDTHKLKLPAEFAASLHVFPQAELERRIHAGVFDTVSTCAEDDKIKELGLAGLYRKNFEMDDCHVFWDPARH
jgi:4-amino-4-deoxy-L-arabinose transferase-like glycosyltransferase